MQHVWIFSFSFVHGCNIYAHERMSVLQCTYFLCIPTYLSYYLTPLLPPYLSRFTLLNSRMASAVVTGARLLLATADAIQNSVGQIFGDDQGEHPSCFASGCLCPPPLKCSSQKPPPSPVTVHHVRAGAGAGSDPAATASATAGNLRPATASAPPICPCMHPVRAKLTSKSDWL